MVAFSLNKVYVSGWIVQGKVEIHTLYRKSRNTLFSL